MTPRLASCRAITTYELLLAKEGIKHRTTTIIIPRANSFTVRMIRALWSDSFRVANRQASQRTPAETQRHLVTILRYYDIERSH